MGSACYLRGSKEIVEILKDEIAKNKLEAQIHLKGSFCLGPCNQGVVVKIENKFFKNLSPENTPAIFEHEILPFMLSLKNGGETI